jgi:hypothetical protein
MQKNLIEMLEEKIHEMNHESKLHYANNVIADTRVLKELARYMNHRFYYELKNFFKNLLKLRDCDPNLDCFASQPELRKIYFDMLDPNCFASESELNEVYHDILDNNSRNNCLTEMCARHPELTPNCNRLIAMVTDQPKLLPKLESKLLSQENAINELENLEYAFKHLHEIFEANENALKEKLIFKYITHSEILFGIFGHEIDSDDRAMLCYLLELCGLSELSKESVRKYDLRSHAIIRAGIICLMTFLFAVIPALAIRGMFLNASNIILITTACFELLAQAINFFMYRHCVRIFFEGFDRYTSQNDTVDRAMEVLGLSKDEFIELLVSEKSTDRFKSQTHENRDESSNEISEITDQTDQLEKGVL